MSRIHSLALGIGLIVALSSLVGGQTLSTWVTSEDATESALPTEPAGPVTTAQQDILSCPKCQADDLQLLRLGSGSPIASMSMAGSSEAGVNLFSGKPAQTIPVASIGAGGIELAISAKFLGFQPGFSELPAGDAPCGTIGCGWTLDLPAIVMNHKGTLTPNDDIYFANLANLGGGQIIPGAISSTSNSEGWFVRPWTVVGAPHLKVSSYHKLVSGPVEWFEAESPGGISQIYGKKTAWTLANVKGTFLLPSEDLNLSTAPTDFPSVKWRWELEEVFNKEKIALGGGVKLRLADDPMNYQWASSIIPLPSGNVAAKRVISFTPRKYELVNSVSGREYIIQTLQLVYTPALLAGNAPEIGMTEVQRRKFRASQPTYDPFLLQNWTSSGMGGVKSGSLSYVQSNETWVSGENTRRFFLGKVAEKYSDATGPFEASINLQYEGFQNTSTRSQPVLKSIQTGSGDLVYTYALASYKSPPSSGQGGEMEDINGQGVSFIDRTTDGDLYKTAEDQSFCSGDLCYAVLKNNKSLNVQIYQNSGVGGAGTGLGALVWKYPCTLGSTTCAASTENADFVGGNGWWAIQGTNAEKPFLRVYRWVNGSVEEITGAIEATLQGSGVNFFVREPNDAGGLSYFPKPLVVPRSEADGNQLNLNHQVGVTLVANGQKAYLIYKYSIPTTMVGHDRGLAAPGGLNKPPQPNNLIFGMSFLMRSALYSVDLSPGIPVASKLISNGHFLIEDLTVIGDRVLAKGCDELPLTPSIDPSRVPANQPTVTKYGEQYSIDGFDEAAWWQTQWSLAGLLAQPNSSQCLTGRRVLIRTWGNTAGNGYFNGSVENRPQNLYGNKVTWAIYNESPSGDFALGGIRTFGGSLVAVSSKYIVMGEGGDINQIHDPSHWPCGGTGGFQVPQFVRPEYNTLRVVWIGNGELQSVGQIPAVGVTGQWDYHDWLSECYQDYVCGGGDGDVITQYITNDRVCTGDDGEQAKVDRKREFEAPMGVFASDNHFIYTYAWGVGAATGGSSSTYHSAGIVELKEGPAGISLVNNQNINGTLGRWNNNGYQGESFYPKYRIAVVSNGWLMNGFSSPVSSPVDDDLEYSNSSSMTYTPFSGGAGTSWAPNAIAELYLTGGKAFQISDKRTWIQSSAADVARKFDYQPNKPLPFGENQTVLKIPGNYLVSGQASTKTRISSSSNGAFFTQKRVVIVYPASGIKTYRFKFLVGSTNFDDLEVAQPVVTKVTEMPFGATALVRTFQYLDPNSPTGGLTYNSFTKAPQSERTVVTYGPQASEHFFRTLKPGEVPSISESYLVGTETKVVRANAGGPRQEILTWLKAKDLPPSVSAPYTSTPLWTLRVDSIRNISCASLQNCRTSTRKMFKYNVPSASPSIVVDSVAGSSRTVQQTYFDALGRSKNRWSWSAPANLAALPWDDGRAEDVSPLSTRISGLTMLGQSGTMYCDEWSGTGFHKNRWTSCAELGWDARNALTDAQILANTNPTFSTNRTIDAVTTKTAEGGIPTEVVRPKLPAGTVVTGYSPATADYSSVVRGAPIPHDIMTVGAPLSDVAVMTAEEGAIAGMTLEAMGWESGGGTYSAEASHTGKMSVKVVDIYGPTRNIIPTSLSARKVGFEVTAWIMGTSATIVPLLILEVRDPGATPGSLAGSPWGYAGSPTQAYAPGKWQLWKIHVPYSKLLTDGFFNVTGRGFRLWAGTGSPSNTPSKIVYVDDMVAHPDDAPYSVSVVDPKTGWTMATFGEQNVPTYYDRDARGSVIAMRDEFGRSFAQSAGVRSKDGAITQLGPVAPMATQDYVPNQSRSGLWDLGVDFFSGSTSTSKFVVSTGAGPGYGQSAVGGQWFVGNFRSSGPQGVARVYLQGTEYVIDVFQRDATSTGRWTMERWSTGDATGTDQERLLAGDFTGDGLTDFVILKPESPAGYTVNVLRSTGSSFAGPYTWSSIPETGSKLLTGDFNADKIWDIVLVQNVSGQATFRVAKGTGTGFGSLGTWGTAQGGYWDLQQWVSGDFNGDQKWDLAKVFSDATSVPNPTAAMLSRADLHVSNGAGFVWSSYRLLNGVGWFWDSQNWIATDVNGDGKADLVNAFSENGTTAIDVHLVSNAGTSISSTASNRWLNSSRPFRGGQWAIGTFDGTTGADFFQAVSK